MFDLNLPKARGGIRTRMPSLWKVTPGSAKPYTNCNLPLAPGLLFWLHPGTASCAVYAERHWRTRTTVRVEDTGLLCKDAAGLAVDPAAGSMQLLQQPRQAQTAVEIAPLKAMAVMGVEEMGMGAEIHQGITVCNVKHLSQRQSK